MKLQEKQINSIFFIFFGIILIGCATAPPQPPPSTPQVNKFNFAILVMDRDRRVPVGQASIFLSVGNDTLVQGVSDDNGQANLSVATLYPGEADARLYVKAPNYHPTDQIIKLSTPVRSVIQMVSKDRPITDPLPTPPRTPQGEPVAQPTPARKRETTQYGDLNSGKLVNGQTVDFEFEANENTPLVINGSGNGEDYFEFQIEIYNSQGILLKSERKIQRTYNGGYVQTAYRFGFTPPTSGRFTLRLRATQGLGTFNVSIDEYK